MKNTLLLILFFCALPLMAQQKEDTRPARVPAYRGVIDKVQPNGDTLQIYLRGDERMHWTMTLDGWQILTNRKGWICYAKARKEEVIPSCRKAHNEGQRTRCEMRWLERHGIRKNE